MAGAAAEPAWEPAHRPPAATTHRATGRRRRGWTIPAALALAAVLLLVVLAGVLSSGGGSDKKSSSGSQASKGAKKSSKPKSQSGGSSTPAAPTPAAPAPSGSGSAGAAADQSTPQGAVASFYKTSVDDPQAAWAMGTDNLHNQLRSEQSFAAQESTLKSIDFPQLKVTGQTATSATVQFRSIARHTTKTDRCRGTISVVKGSSGWLVDQLHIAGCTPGPVS